MKLVSLRPEIYRSLPSDSTSLQTSYVKLLLLLLLLLPSQFGTCTLYIDYIMLSAPNKQPRHAAWLSFITLFNKIKAYFIVLPRQPHAIRYNHPLFIFTVLSSISHKRFLLTIYHILIY